jgi:hypothetical protein
MMQALVVTTYVFGMHGSVVGGLRGHGVHCWQGRGAGEVGGWAFENLGKILSIFLNHSCIGWGGATPAHGALLGYILVSSSFIRLSVRGAP